MFVLPDGRFAWRKSTKARLAAGLRRLL